MLNNTFNIKKNIQFYLQATKNRQSSHHANEGFTLIELLVAAAIMSIVVTLAGFGLVEMLKQNATSESESDRRTNLNRALDFIANEVRMANNLANTTSSSLPSGATVVMSLTIPSDNTTRVYYTRAVNTSCEATTTAPTNLLWSTPNMICRRLIPSGGSPDSMLVDGVTNGGFTATITNNSQVVLSLTGKITTGKLPGPTRTLSVNTTAVTRAK